MLDTALHTQTDDRVAESPNPAVYFSPIHAAIERQEAGSQFPLLRTLVHMGKAWPNIFFRYGHPQLLHGSSHASQPDPLHGSSHASQRTALDKRLHDAYLFALANFSELDKDTLAKACREASLLASCAIFQEKLFPEICVDPHGEVTLSCKAKGGYADIGVSGNQTLSFGVRNDINPELSAHADMEWVDYKIPSSLLKALDALQA